MCHWQSVGLILSALRNPFKKGETVTQKNVDLGKYSMCGRRGQMGNLQGVITPSRSACPDLPITKSVLIAAARYGRYALSLLLRQVQCQIPITGAITLRRKAFPTVGGSWAYYTNISSIYLPETHLFRLRSSMIQGTLALDGFLISNQLSC